MTKLKNGWLAIGYKLKNNPLYDERIYYINVKKIGLILLEVLTLLSIFIAVYVWAVIGGI